MSESVSEHQVRVYEYAKVRTGRWFTIQELSTDANIPDASAKAHAVRFEEMGIFDRMRASPAHLFRLSEFAGTRDPKTIKRLDAAIPVFAERRHDRIQRELHALGIRHRVDHTIPPSPPTIDSTAEPVARIDVQSSGLRPDTRPSTESGPISSTEIDLPMISSGNSAPAASSTQLTVSAPLSVTVPRSSKVDLLLSMVAREEGASLDELVAALGNLAHSIRASISVESRKRGLKIECINSRYYLRSTP